LLFVLGEFTFLLFDAVSPLYTRIKNIYLDEYLLVHRPRKRLMEDLRKH